MIRSQNLAAQRGLASRLERGLLGNWQFGGVWILQAGLPFTVYTSASFAPVYDANHTLIGNNGGDYNGDGYNYDVRNIPSFGPHLSGKRKTTTSRACSHPRPSPLRH